MNDIEKILPSLKEAFEKQLNRIPEKHPFSQIVVDDLPNDIMQKLLKEEKEKSIKKLKKEALNKAKVIASFLKDNYSAEKVYVFGGLLHEIDDSTDIYLMVFGLNEKLRNIETTCEQLSHPFELYLFTAEDAYPPFVERVLNQGIII